MISGDIIYKISPEFFSLFSEIFFLSLHSLRFRMFIFVLDDDYFLMGNQIAHIPNQILNVETYFNDLSGYDYVKK
jgi:hypothetical protein